MSWLLEKWFGSKENLEQVREEIHKHVQKEVYLGVSGIENPEQSATRVPSQDLDLMLKGPWDKLDENESELLKYIHDELPAVVRDEVGIVPFYAHATADGYLVLAFIRNATSRSVLLQRLPLSLETPEGEVVCRKTFELLTFGPIADMASRPCEFLFPWKEFSRIPEEEVPLKLVHKRAPVEKRSIPNVETGGLDKEEWANYAGKVAETAPLEDGQVDLQVLDVKEGENNGVKVVVLFRNQLDKGLEFTQVPILLRDKAGRQIAKVNFTLENMRVESKSYRIWAFGIPASALKAPVEDVSQITAFVPKPKQQKKAASTFVHAENKGLLQ